jgi:type II secretory pathway pseudopilin PulG
MMSKATASPPSKEAGFSLVEALVVMAVSAMLLSVLTSILSFSRASNQRLADHAIRQGDQFYTDLQAQTMTDYFYLDPLLQSRGRRAAANDRDGRFFTQDQWASRDGSMAFEGDETAFSMQARSVLDQSGTIETVSLRWRTDQEGRKLTLSVGDDLIEWPTLYPDGSEFRYMIAPGEYVRKFPPEETDRRAFQRTEDPDPTQRPMAIMAVTPATNIPHLILDLP